ncbi:transcriptional regulator, pucr family [Bacillus sp. OxB-1]|uniref:XylR N-terminal domain-containing protein n=1 Tax=Bacillus sp. (strain OxB-1) TaxID=98228 RepID=UPI0005823716|nr:XylR N-terminal domain-containing protein [Bacillus sp. OxB-1]BAQ11914.1 transcriptional regulator, pucr family [Bacillus sp. OxB-1]
MTDRQPALQEKNGVIELEGERILLTSAAVFGTLRKDLIENLGTERMKGFLLRYGWNLGATDAAKVLAEPHDSIEDALRQGPHYHMLKGYTSTKTTELEIVKTDGGAVESVTVSGIWCHSYEAEESLRLFGLESEPVCHTLIGYASGFYSTICNQTIIFKEVACRGIGDSECRYIGKSLEQWGGEADAEQRYYENDAIIHELEQTYEQLREERDHLAKVALIHTKLAEEVIDGNDLESITKVIVDIIKKPILIEDIHFHRITSAGISESDHRQMREEFQKYVQERQSFRPKQTVQFQTEGFIRLMAPIYLQKKIYGYCSFLYGLDEESPSDIDRMILERTVTVCSLLLLNEKVNFEAEERVKGHFLDQILNGEISSIEEIRKRGSHFQLDLQKPYYIIALEQQGAGEKLFLNEQIVEETVHFFKNRKPGLLAGQQKGYAVLLVQTDLAEEDQGILSFCRKLLEHLRKKDPRQSLRIGVSTEGISMDDVRGRFDEAVTALKIGNREQSIVAFENLGVIGMLIHSLDHSAVEQKGRQLLSPIYESDEEKDEELLRTMYVFLLNGGNLEKTMRELALSMSGLRYRIEKVETLLGRNLRDPETGYEMMFLIKALIVAGKLTF